MPLNRDTIINRAFEILNESGPDSLTMRRLAQKLAVEAPAIYWHFKNKQELLDEMGTQVMREAAGGAALLESSADWQSWAMSYGQGLRQTLLRYREGARMFSGTRLTDATLYAILDSSLRRLMNAGFSLREAVSGLSTLYSYTIGFVIEEQAVLPMPGEANPQYDLTQRGERINKELHPLAYAAGEEIFTGYASRFQAGLETIIIGMSARLTALSNQQSAKP
jgi:AcrR family transcriptional regulator